MDTRDPDRDQCKFTEMMTWREDVLEFPEGIGTGIHDYHRQCAGNAI